jgi:putative phosphoribosyl transferase
VSGSGVLFHDRQHAGRVLALQLEHLRDRPGLQVLALPRGGVPVGYEVAHALQAPLDLVIVRKLGIPGNEEFAMGAIASGGVRVMNSRLGTRLGEEAIAAVVRREQVELERRERLYRDQRPAPQFRGRTVVVVDDGLATGSTMRAAVQAVRQQRPGHLCVAVPVGSREACELLRREADEVVCAAVPVPMRAVGLAYESFDQVSDAQVRELLAAAQLERALGAH